MIPKKSLPIVASILGGLVICGFILFLSRDLWMDQINQIRAERHLESAEAAMAEENWEEAARRGQAAHFLIPQKPRPQILVAEALLEQRSGDAIEWWRRILQEPEIPVEGLRKLTGLLLDAQRLEVALPFLERLVELEPENEETRLLWLRALSLRQRSAKAYEVARGLIQSGTDSWAAHQRFLQLQQRMNPGDDTKPVTQHLRTLIGDGGQLAQRAARELASMEDAAEEDRLYAAEILRREGDDPMDELYGLGVEYKLGARSTEALLPPLEVVVNSGDVGQLEELLRWSVWMRKPSLVLERVAWDRYREEGGTARPYFEALVAAGDFTELLRLAELATAQEMGEEAMLLVYRATAQDSLGLSEQASETLQLAVEVVEPGQTRILERHLLRKNRWDLLMELYNWLLAENPENPIFLQKNLAAHYYLGEQDWLMERLSEVTLEDFSRFPQLQSFIAYLKLILEGPAPELHREVEGLLSEYPRISDYQLLAGVSYLLQGQLSLARSFAENMPLLEISAPRHLRVSAILLGLPEEDLFRVGERSELLPREQYLLSQFQESPNR